MAESLALFAEAGNVFGLGNVAWMYRALPELGLAEGGAGPVQAALEQSLTRFRQQGKPRACALLASALGGLARDQGDYARATAWLDEALRLDRQLGDREQLNADQHERGELALVQGDDARAEALEAAGLEGFRARGNTERMEAALLNLGYVAQHQGERGRAAAVHREALALAVELGDRWHSIECVAGLAGAAEPARAVRLLGAAAALRDVDQSQPVLARRREIERNLAAARAQLDEATFATAWAEGQAMPLEEAIAYALEDDPTAE
jgi:tetratricopeptide (TPR) repeat protein